MSDPLLELTLIVALGIGAQLLAVWLRIPAIIPLLLVGVLAGPGVADLIDPEALFGDLLSPLVSLAVGVVLFEGALGLRPSGLDRDSRRVLLRLLSLGVLITWAAATIGAIVVLDLPVAIALLTGAILIVSGPTVVLPLLAFIRPRPELDRVLRWEGIIVDPIGAIIAALVFAAISTSGGFQPGGLAISAGTGLVIGLGAAGVLLAILRTGRLTGQQASVLTLGVVIAATGAADLIREDAGLVAAIVAGMAMGTQQRVPTGQIAEFKGTLATVLIALLFVVLAALVDPGDVIDLGWSGLVYVGLLVVLARPAAVLASTLRSRMSWGQRAVVASMTPRGIIAASTASSFSLLLVADGVPGADKILPVTFLVIVCTVVLTTVLAPAVASATGASEDPPPSEP